MKRRDLEPPTLRRGPDAPPRATLMELFFDLVFIGAFALTSMTLAAQPTWSGAAKAIVPLMAMWWIWTNTALVTDFYDPQQRPIQAVLAGVMVGTSQMAATTPHAFGKAGLVFAASYVIVNVGRAVLLLVVIRGRDRVASQRTWRFGIWYCVSAVPWLLGGLAGQQQTRFALWGLALAIDYISSGFRYPTPWLGRVPREQYDRAGEHLGERYQQLMILALGDMILVATLQYSRVPRTGIHTVAALLAFITTVLLWQIYVYRAGAILESVTVRSPGRSARWAPYTHFVMVIGVIITSAGFDLTIRRPSGELPTGWVGAIVGGPALFMIGRIVFEYEVFVRFSWARMGGVGLLLAGAPAVDRFLSPVLAAAFSAAVLLGIAITDQRRVRARARKATSHRHHGPTG